MIQKIGKITIYVTDQEQAKDFWVNQVGFVVKFEQSMGPMKWLEVGPSEDEFTTFVLYNKEAMAKQNPSASLGHPNIILSTSDIQATYDSLQSKQVKVGELQIMPYGKMFSFSDPDGNAYLVREDQY